jgi:hypothetical protein
MLQAAMQNGQLADTESHRGLAERRTRRVQRRSNRAEGEKRGLEEAGLRWSRFPRAWYCAGRRQLSAAFEQCAVRPRSTAAGLRAQVLPYRD